MAKKTIIQTSAAPAAIGAYSQAVGYGGLLFVSGQVGLDSHTGDIVEGGIDAQTRQAMRNVRAILEASGLDLSHVVAVRVQLRNMSDYHAMNAAYGGFFDENPPARTCNEVSRLPKEALVQIEVTAAAPAPVVQSEDASDAEDAEDAEAESNGESQEATSTDDAWGVIADSEPEVDAADGDEAQDDGGDDGDNDDGDGEEEKEEK